MKSIITKEEKHAGSWQKILRLLPTRLTRELENIRKSRRDLLSEASELRLRAGGVSTLALSSGSLPLAVRLCEDELEEIIFGACDGSLYAYRDTLAEGYVPMSCGVRLGVCGRARYEGGELVGVRGITSLVFRLPYGECAFADDIAELFLSASHAGMLIYAPPGGGKTTALRSLVRVLSSGRYARRVCVVDERCEFIPEDYIMCAVDILRGYKRAEGIELAVRTLNPEIIVIDEIASDEAKSLEGVIRCGIPIIATSHAQTMDELMTKPHISRFCEMGAFDFLVGITKAADEYGFVATGISGVK